MTSALLGIEVDKRAVLLENLALTGGAAAIKGLGDRIDNELQPFIAVSDVSGDQQVLQTRWLEMPKYFSLLEPHPEYAGFLGCQLVTKLCFIDPKNYVTQANYNEFGPPAIHSKP